MITFSIIQKSQLEGTNRIDAEYYQQEYLEINKILSKNKTALLNSIASKITQGPNPNFINEGICCLNGRNVKNNRVNTEDSNYISELEYIKYKNFQVKKGDILITLKGLGSIGKTGYTFDEMKCIFSRDIGLIRINSDVTDKFIYAFLLSKYGSKQIERSTTGGTGQLTLATSYIKKIKVPSVNSDQMEKISSLIEVCEADYKNSKVFYSRAENLLLEELGLKDYQIEDDLSFVVNFPDIKSTDRVDAEYFQPKYQKLFTIIKTHDLKLLGEITTIKKGFEPGSEAYREEGKKFIRVSNLTKLGFDYGDQKHISDDLYNKLKTNFEPKEGEILLTKDATPGISYLIKEPIEGIISGGILRLKIKTDINPEYVSLVLNSIVGQWQAQRDAGGAIIVHWRPEQIKNMRIPILPKETQQKIVDLVRQSHEARKKSKELLEEAKRKVEEMVEKGDVEV